MRLTKDPRTKLEAKGGQPVVEGQFKMEYTSGTLDEATMTYVGKKPLVFAAHLEKIEFAKDTGQITNLEPLSQVVKLLAPEDRVWD